MGSTRAQALVDPLVTERDFWRFWSKVIPASNGCWEWTGAADKNGYGRMGIGGRGGRPVLATRIAVATLLRPLADGEEALHHCDHPPCVNPAHLFIGSKSENMQDAVRKGRQRSPYRGVTHCKYGHEFTPENTQRFTNSNGNPGRRCITCDRRLAGPRKTTRRTSPRADGGAATTQGIRA